MLRKLFTKVRQLSATERRFAAAAWAGAPLVEALLRTAGLQRTLQGVQRTSDWVRQRRPFRGETIAPERGEAIIDSVYRLHPWAGRCLPRALLHYGLQRRRGAQVRFVIGVKRPTEDTDTIVDTLTAGDDIAAHAWVESLRGPRRSLDFVPILTVPHEREAA